ncbi:MAG TPA: cytochrome P450 [Ilumatobacteraceae bacterium]
MGEQRLVDQDLWGGDPHAFFTRMRAEEPVYRDGDGIWGLMLHGDVCAAERQPTMFSSSRGSRPNTEPQPSMIDSDDPWHAAQRRLVAQGFTRRQMAAYESHVVAVARELVDAVVTRGTCDIVADIAKPLPMTLIGEMLGAERSDHDRLQHWSDLLVSGADGAQHRTAQTMAAAFEYYEYITRVLEERRAEPGDDLVSTLIHSEVDGESLDDAQIIGNALLLLVGGNETTRNVIAGGLHALITNPEQLAIARASADDLTDVVEEALRWVTPINNMNRHTTADVEMRGVTIPAGSQVLMVYSSANRDETVFADPFQFDVTRHPNPHIAFGFGPHLCLGAALARLELNVIFREVLTRLDDLRLADPEFVPTYGHSSFVRGMPALPVRFATGSR